jgi:hypothetical protein
VLKQLLEEFLSIQGVTAAALVGRDGFVIEMAGQSPVDIDALGAFGSCSVRFFDYDEYTRDLGPFRQLSIKFGDSTVIFTPITSEEFLAIIADSEARVNKLLLDIEKKCKRIASAI